MRERQAPADFIIYKGRAAAQFSLKEGQPRRIQTRKGEYTATDKGCVFVVCANCRGPKDYDWDNKVTIGLSEHEIGKMLKGLKGTKQTFYHDPGKGKSTEGQIVKTMSIAPSDDGKKLFLNTREVKNGVENKINAVTIEPEEALSLSALLAAALPRILGWT